MANQISGRLDSINQDIAVLIGAMLQARQAVERRALGTIIFSKWSSAAMARQLVS
jgi:hypothetical protein